MNRRNVRMIERGEDTRFALEARQTIGMGRERGRQDLDGDVAPESRIARAVDLAHAAGADWLEDLIGTEPPSHQCRAARNARQSSGGGDRPASEQAVR